MINEPDIKTLITKAVLEASVLTTKLKAILYNCNAQLVMLSVCSNKPMHDHIRVALDQNYSPASNINLQR